jgi:hypothetical protein
MRRKACFVSRVILNQSTSLQNRTVVTPQHVGYIMIAQEPWLCLPKWMHALCAHCALLRRVSGDSTQIDLEIVIFQDADRRLAESDLLVLRQRV